MSIGLLERAARFDDRVAIRDASGSHTYGDLVAAATALGRGLPGDPSALVGRRVAYLVPPGFAHVVAQWGIWEAGAIAVPLAVSHPAPELGKIIEDARPTALLVAAELSERAREATLVAQAEARVAGAESASQVQIVALDDAGRRIAHDAASAAPPQGRPAGAGLATAEGGEAPGGTGGDALMLYTSGTTGRPKGVVSTHDNLAAQITTLVDAWEWSDADRILHVLPLHHVHGIVNALSCALWSGATCRFAAPDPVRTWETLAAGEVSVFMAVPTTYRRLAEAWEAADAGVRKRWSSGAEGLRLMVSGSAALPVDLFAHWRRITGHALLERYGMTEIGMALSNPLRGERRPGTVGQPLTGVETRLVGDDGEVVDGGEQGEIQVRGSQVFREYWRRPDETRAAFTDDGWFRTGDEAVVEAGYWRIVGRRSIDIIKTGGYKVSALEVEAVLREHPEVDDAAVIGTADRHWGERLCAAVVKVAGGTAGEDELRAWCRSRLAPYKVPKELVIAARLPRNTMGKVTKADLRPMFFVAEDETTRQS